MSVEDQANAMADYYDGHPEPPPDNATPAQQAAYDQQMAAWEGKFGPGGPPDPPTPPPIPGPPSPGAGMPAARIGDLCAHGGAIIGPGCPTVMIGNMVAVRGMPAMDQAACPMFNGPVPHATGTILKGSTTVMIGYMPAARVSDPIGPPTVCAGNQIAMGCMTVMIGDQGGSGGGGGGGGAGTGVAAPPSPAAAAAQGNTLVVAKRTGTPFCELCPGVAPAALVKAAPSVAKPPEPKKPKTIVCALKSLQLKCGHGERGYVLNVGDIDLLGRPQKVLEVVSGSDGDEIVVTTQLDKPYCPDHLKRPIQTSPTSAMVQATPMSATAKFTATPPPDLTALLRSNPFALLWLPAVNKQTYDIRALTCGQAQAAQVVLFPDLKWTFNINFFSFSSGKSISHKVRGKKTDRAKTSETSRGVSVSLEYGREKRELGVEFKHEIETALSAGKRIKGILDRTIEFLAKFGDIEIDILWPSLSLEGEWKYAERKGDWSVGMEGKISVKLDPLIGLEGKWNIIDTALKMFPPLAAIVLPVKKAIEAAGDLEVGIWLELSGQIGAAMTAECTVNSSKWDCGGELSGAIEGEISGGIEPKGDDGWVEFTVGGKCGITGSGRPIVDAHGLGFSKGKLVRDAAVVYVHTAITIVFEIKQDREWTLAEEDQLWSRGEPFYFIEKRAGGGAG